jgi:hypothetical protein
MGVLNIDIRIGEGMANVRFTEGIQSPMEGIDFNGDFNNDFA